MKDPHTHVQREWMTGVQMLREVFGSVGIAVDAPKTVTTGCGKRRQYASTSQEPSKVTCLACIDYAVTYLKLHVEMCKTALDMNDILTPERRDQIEAALRNQSSLLGEFEKMRG